VPLGPATSPLATSEATPALQFAVVGAEAVRFAAGPMIAFRLRVTRVGGGPIRSLALAVQIRIAATRRPYDDAERARLVELFGAPADWGRNLQSLLWTHQSVVVPAFEDATEVDVTVPCTYDFEVSATKYLYGLDGGEAPLELTFNGTMFYAAPDGAMRVALVPWTSEASFRLPVAVWREAMDLHFAGAAWLRVSADVFERLRAYRARGTLATWDATLDALLTARERDLEP
jgi:Family of unknown function (DUF6084)